MRQPRKTIVSTIEKRRFSSRNYGEVRGCKSIVFEFVHVFSLG
jgi:hypothetical protein